MSETNTRFRSHAQTRTARQRTQNEQETEDSDELACPECGATGITVEKRGETVCEECGVVIEDDMIDHGPELRAFDSRERDQKSRVGAPSTKTLHDKGLSTKIDWKDSDASGSALSARKRSQMVRLRTWDERFRAKSARERNLKQALGEIDRMASALGLPKNVRETAGVIYRRALYDDLLPGRSIEAMATASLYAAARQANTPRSLDEFQPISRVDRQEYARAYRYLGRELGLAIEPADPAKYLPRFASELEVPETVERRARELLETGKSQGVHSGKSPVGLAAGALYAGSLLTNERITQQTIADETDVSEVTIRNRYQELLDAHERAEQGA
ncbi:transcription initiation factor IIB [Halapricum hydrolyticum]|uniref:Transcription initiation factor IIB n=1 Tax=Halapricum hydrolyticum TaxID=2979991 RepID=A0AAE3IEM5_9EURY|nr:TFIIB-type zinc ribbon-containing protein [Halapricum hydrolyticum]MCU4719541.1 transcription initiation factor IIB 2 [Halapricum hydrolyticum]MCU4728516.1 transcription initiation factor IIB 2 [Halapricum hydrolyticum]